MAVRGLVFDVSHGCTADGPGLRTTVFMKGCALDCPWCQNPEGKSRRPQIGFDAARCLGCGECAAACPQGLIGRRGGIFPLPPAGKDRGEGASKQKQCSGCGRCADACPSGARRLWGRTVSVDELLEELLVDEAFWRGTSGGVTFSGGEPLRQARFVLECAAGLRRRGLHVVVETSGSWPAELVTALSQNVDLIIFDIKHTDPAVYRPVLGRSYRRALENYQRLLAGSAELRVRITLVPGFNDSVDSLTEIARWLQNGSRPVPLELLPFHRLAAAKASLLGVPYPYADSVPSTPTEIERARELLVSRGLTVIA